MFLMTTNWMVKQVVVMFLLSYYKRFGEDSLTHWVGLSLGAYLTSILILCLDVTSLSFAGRKKTCISNHVYNGRFPLPI